MPLVVSRYKMLGNRLHTRCCLVSKVAMYISFNQLVVLEQQKQSCWTARKWCPTMRTLSYNQEATALPTDSNSSISSDSEEDLYIITIDRPHHG